MSVLYECPNRVMYHYQIYMEICWKQKKVLIWKIFSPVEKDGFSSREALTIITERDRERERERGSGERVFKEIDVIWNVHGVLENLISFRNQNNLTNSRSNDLKFQLKILCLISKHLFFSSKWHFSIWKERKMLNRILSCFYICC